ncbi:DHH family phosphoesterase [Desulfovibrio sp.]|uniref:DHH family phosphoesterase n=1 Tax=Desulfovibrio sp. TaxID=885 RepID=UPI0023CA817D|nr:DHH family phosphoesterase [Desulfovibrio sp.]MDE7241226.1 DHH family phosphoesterase [Desulfovibrio sp.]
MPLIDAVPEKWRGDALRVADAVRGLDRVLIAAHVNLDGDALGSMAAAGWILKALGREFTLYSATGKPVTLDFLPLPARLHTSLSHLPFAPESALLLDCDTPGRLGRELADCVADFASVNIDHHLGGPGMGTVANWVTPGAAATAQLMACVALALELPLTGQLADAVALGLITDTGGFCHGNTTADVFELCALLSRGGCRIAELRERLDSGWSMGRLHLWSRLLGRVRLACDERVAICPVFREDLRECHASREEMEGLVDWFRRIKGVRVAALLREEGREEGEESCKFSLRSRGWVDVRVMAQALGGGGHRNAAGGTIDLPMAAAEGVLLETVGAALAAQEAAR